MSEMIEYCPERGAVNSNHKLSCVFLVPYTTIYPILPQINDLWHTTIDSPNQIGIGSAPRQKTNIFVVFPVLGQAFRKSDDPNPPNQF